ncbi:MAG: glycosyltransferase [Bdellovibrionales bacterium]|nr:glycosyltransferase [Bdellovibrionales bacterium]
MAKGYRSYFSLTTLLRSEKYQSLYLNSFFNWKFSIFPLLARKVSYQCRKRTILAPRGELSPGALSIKWLKKRLFITSSRIIDLYRDVIWHASSEEEASEIRRFFPKAKVVVARNLLVVPGKMLDDKNLSSLKQTSPLRVVFVSRICEKKNLDFALEVLKSVRAQIVFNIYGPQEDPIYFRKCQAIISSLPDNVAVEFRGAVSHEEIPDIFMSHDVFLFPTKGENFGHVIYESLAVGTPVLISDRTPWSDLNEAGAGWIIPLEMPSLFTAVLNDLASLPRRHRLEMRRKAVSYSRRIANDKVPIEQTFKLFATVD